MKKIILPALICFFVDRILKMFCMSNLNFGESISIIKNFFSITLISNTGAAFNILADKTYILLIITVVFMLFIYYFFIKNENLDNKMNILYGVLFGGIIGNLIDRIFYGYVIDYFDFIIFNYQAPIFNFADICIVLSVFIILIKTIKGEKNEI